MSQQQFFEELETRPAGPAVRIAEVALPVPLHKTFHYRHPDGLDLRPGTRVRVPFGPRRLVGVVLSTFSGVPERALKAVEAALDREPALDAELLASAQWMARRYSAPIGECLKAVLPSSLRDLDEPAPWPPRTAERRAPGFELTPGQKDALDQLGARLTDGRGGAALLYGVPASGKTEVYLRLIRRALERGGQALFLLPEISLTRPFFDEFTASLEAPVVLWHSKLTPRERRRAWLGLRRGEVRVVVGARSACLLPLPRLRLIVIDEEQDESFKQEGQGPLYHARDVAFERARRTGALLVLGSATPSLEAWRLGRDGGAQLVRMPERVSAVPPPAVRVVPPPRDRGCLAPELLAALRERLARREQSILLVNRRGFSTLVMCRKCGWVDRCPECAVAKILHEAADKEIPPPRGPGGHSQYADGDGRPIFYSRCHHCERKTPVPGRCAKCGETALRVSGTGTQKVVAELKRVLPAARVLRMDRDTVSKEGREEAGIYRRFLNGEADVLVGTKLVAKSFHFPECTLVGVVDADAMLNMPDFRSAERTMQLLAQVAGRSGRAGKAGEVLLQTAHPEHLAIAKTIAGDYAAFADAELGLRRELGYPPHAALVRLLWSGAKEEAVSAAAQAATERLRAELTAFGHELVGPAPAVLRQLSKKFRYHALLKVPDPAQLDKALAAARRVELPSGVRLKLNVDPYDLF